MSELIKNMIAQIADKNFKGAQSTFEDVMTSKIGNAFVLEKVKLAGSIFNDIDIVAESVDPEDDEDLDLDLDNDEDDEDLDEDEELDEENLSELSKKTLGSYVKKASDSQFKNGEDHEYHGNKANKADVTKGFGKETRAKHSAVANNAMRKASNRSDGVRRAVSKLVK